MFAFFRRAMCARRHLTIRAPLSTQASHFTANGGTQDYAYGQSACKSLAQSDPDRAVMNADSHEYFAENNPALS